MTQRVIALPANYSSFEIRFGTSNLSVGDGSALAGWLGATAPPEPDRVGTGAPPEAAKFESPGGYSSYPPGPCAEGVVGR